MRFSIGTSGFGYAAWRGPFHPADVPAARMVADYAERLLAIEIDGAFYRLPRRSLLEEWVAQVPEPFRFALAASQRITHQKRLHDVADETRYLLDLTEALGTRFGAVLFQLPPDMNNWAKDLEVKEFSEGTEVLYFPCCYPSYETSLKKVSEATAHILNSTGIEFGVLGPKENCCGESVRKAGNEVLFKRLARENIKAFIENGVKKILVSSPHCYHTFKDEYPEFMVNFEVVHVSQYFIRAH